jgi:hypothetical protein
MSQQKGKLVSADPDLIILSRDEFELELLQSHSVGFEQGVAYGRYTTAVQARLAIRASARAVGLNIPPEFFTALDMALPTKTQEPPAKKG